MVAFENISRSSGRRSIRVVDCQGVRIRHAQNIAAECLLGHALLNGQCVYWLSETQPLICRRDYIPLLKRIGRVTHPEYLQTGNRRDHIAKAEKALGRSLPRGAEVHHVDGVKWNNANSNLVICQDSAYHALLHMRARVVKAGGNPDAQKWCHGCERPVDLAAFNVRRNGTVDSRCRECINKAKRDSWPASHGRAVRSANPRRRAVRSDIGKRRVP